MHNHRSTFQTQPFCLTHPAQALFKFFSTLYAEHAVQKEEDHDMGWHKLQMNCSLLNSMPMRKGQQKGRGPHMAVLVEGGEFV